MPLPREVYATWTNAPENYDYAHCMRTGKTKENAYAIFELSEVWMETCEENAKGQVARYHSGMFVATEPVRVEDPGPVVRCWTASHDQDGHADVLAVVTFDAGTRAQIRQAVATAAHHKAAMQFECIGKVEFYSPNDEGRSDLEDILSSVTGLKVASVEAAEKMFALDEGAGPVLAEYEAIDLNVTPHGAIQWWMRSRHYGIFSTDNCCGDLDLYAPKPEPEWKCSECGSTEGLQFSFPMWVNAQDTGDETDWEGDWEAQPAQDSGKCWCTTCDQNGRDGSVLFERIED